MAPDGPLILVIDDEPQIRRMLKLSLEARGYRLIEAANAVDGLRRVSDDHPDLVILDLGLPGMDGHEALIKLREWSATPVIVLSIRAEESDKVSLLDAGANDYLTKPFGTRELMARIRAALRHRLPGSTDGIFSSGDLRLDFTKHLAKLGAQDLKLTPTEYSLLRYLALNAGKIVTHGQLIRELWGPTAVPDASYLRVYIMQLRRKIEKNPSDPRIIIAEPGIGFRLVAEENE